MAVFHDYSDRDLEGVESENILDQKENSSYLEPDLTLISELLESIERNPQAQEAHVLLMEQYAMSGWHDAAKEEAERILEYDPHAEEARKYIGKPCKSSPPAGAGSRTTMEKSKSGSYNNNSKNDWRDGKETRTQRDHIPAWRPSVVPIKSSVSSLKELENGYMALLSDAEHLLSEMKSLKDFGAPDCDSQIADLAVIARGQVSKVVEVKPLEGVKSVAETVVANSKNGGLLGLDAAVEDLESLARWLRKSGDTTKDAGKGKSRSTCNDNQDEVRQAMFKRVKALKALLPLNLQPLADTAMMHADHEFLGRKYINAETMCSLDPISEIPRSNFWTSEDGYAWDMEELAGAIKSEKGVMRNPLSRQMFTRTDIKAIIQHPLGKGLQALQLEQSKLKRGVRSNTTDELSTLAKVLLADMSEDGKPSHLAVEAFVSYLETLPTCEQEAIDGLKVPAKDSHTGIPFDSTIGETVKDVQANKVCSHKAGDFLAQAVRYLK